MDVRAHNRAAWNKAVDLQDQWTIPVSPQEIAAARRGDWQIILTPTLPVPRTWFPQKLYGADVLLSLIHI